MTIAVSAQNFFTNNPTGVEFYAREIVKNLSEVCGAEDRIIVYVKKLPKNIQSEAVESLRSQKVFFRELKFRKFFNLLGMAFEARKKRFDAIFCPSSVAPLFGSKNITTTIHGLEFKNCPQAYSVSNRLWMDFSTRLSLFLSQKIIVPSLATKNDLVKFYKTDPAKIFIIKHGSPTSFQPTEFILKQKNLEQILFLGTLEKRKGPEVLAEAFERIHIKFPDASLIFAGPFGLGAEKFLIKIKKSSAKDKIFLKGYVEEEEKRSLLLRSAILALPSKAEGFGLPILEGQASRCAVICSDIEVLQEVAGDGALFFKREDPEDLAQKLLDIMMDNEARVRLISNGTKNLERFSWKESAQKTYHLISLHA
ncbi:MAG: Glycosyl transferase group 1 [Parcubacteria group bacterium GW2011_GWA2_39_18]|nr:MAG: Glycosyl transferase group 1 [Parcubacteria group bacterium GW2011_GWA2_39_18]